MPTITKRKKRGRPPINNKAMEKQIPVRVTKYLYKDIDRLAMSHGHSLSDEVRWALLDWVGKH